MNERIEFTNNYTDLSTDTGFQFEFNSDRCGTSYRPRITSYHAGNIANALDTASSLSGGVFNQAAQLGERAKSAGWQRVKDEAFVEAAKELRPQFKQCPRCQIWVCIANLNSDPHCAQCGAKI